MIMIKTFLQTCYSLFRLSYGKGITGLLLFFCLSFSGCNNDSDDDYVFPALINEFADLYSDQNGLGTKLITDNGNTYIPQTSIQNLLPEAVYRIICGFELTGNEKNGYPVVKVYQARNVTLLKEGDLTETDPTNVISVWKGGNYINFRLTPKTQGGTQNWGYKTEQITTTTTGKTYHLTLCHDQGDDPCAYTTTIYASLPFSGLNLQKGDSIAITIQTFDTTKVWQFAY